MKLLVLLLCAVAINEASHWANFKRNAEEQRIVDHYAENDLQNFDEVFGPTRKLRLQKIAEHFRKQSNISVADEEVMNELSKNFVAINTSSSLPAHDSYSLNEAAGITDYLFQGDIHLTDEQLDSLERELEDVDEHGRSKRQVSTFRKWANNQVFYYFKPQTSERVKAVVKYALGFIQARTCLTFQESSTAVNRIGVYIGAGCFSIIGMAGGDQQLSLGNGCTISGTVIHEFYHALGVWHMQMRSDRDRYITINLGAVQAAQRFNFDKLQTNKEINYTPYEYGSTMHYGARSFVTGNGISIVPKDQAYLYTIGGSFASFYDIDMVNQHYGCYAKCPKTTNCKNGGKPNPANCNVCNCPAGYGGNYCDQRPSGCGTQLSATSAWQSETVKVGTNDNSRFQDVPQVCNYWITAPAGSKIEVKITQITNPQCQYGCAMNGVEFKTNDILATNPRICCPEFFNKGYVSKLNPTPVILYSHFYYSTYTFSYRTVSRAADDEVTPKTPTD